MILQQLNSYFLLFALSILTLATALPSPDPDAEYKISVYIVPGNNTFPEGIARQPNSPYFYVGSVTTGDIYRGSVYEKNLVKYITGSTYGIINAVGMRVDCKDRLYVAGGPGGIVFVFDLHTKQLLHRFSNGLPQNTTLLNDLDIDQAGNIYITDTFQPTLFRIKASDVNRQTVDLPLEKWVDTTEAFGTGGNGIVVTEDQKYLLVAADVNAGEIWRAVISSKKIDKVNFGGAVIGVPDGLLIRKNILYSVNSRHEIGQFIQVIKMDPGNLSGTATRRITSPLFEKPSTIAFDGPDLLVVNFQYGVPLPVPVLPFTVVRVAAGDEAQ
ncbi:NHL repeat-containing protein [Choiromyces venosus 120613-1]|uniref:NHL repeat-containing protein n=1 Tax=Choiromyces venosus 120613-1 TaxID=1336337 RepID=A0A3N4JL08_9PEZI|nr:NHL repeat-containing protein [Choiromyces venosus 120613-1]